MSAMSRSTVNGLKDAVFPRPCCGMRTSLLGVSSGKFEEIKFQYIYWLE